jgi:hypothetical protein
LGYASAIDSNGRRIWIADAHRGDGKRFVVRADGIGAAMDAIPLFDPDPPPKAKPHNRVEQWTILVTPGYYDEVIRFKPFVNVVGLLKEAVTIAGQSHDAGHHAAQIYLCSNTLLSNVTVAIPGNSQPGDFAVRGYDVNTYPGNRRYYDDVHFLGLSNVDFSRFPPRGSEPGQPGGLIKFDGGWRTVIFRDVGGNYEAPDGYGIELVGRQVPEQNADCHFINCFFDALFLNDEGGFIHITDCFEVHLRNSLVRVNYKKVRRIRTKKQRPPITAVKTTSTGRRTQVLIEGSSLYGPGPSVLDVGENTVCHFRHSSTDSKSGNGMFIASGPDGIGDNR